MNAIEYECGDKCDYHEAVHGKNGRSIYDDKFKNKCCRCTRPMSGRMEGHGIYPPADGGFKMRGGDDGMDQ
jgi:hypothetical protein